MLSRIALASSVGAARRASAASVRAYSVPNQPEFKREGPTAHKHDPSKFDDGRDDTLYQNQATKHQALKEDFPNKPLRDTENPESEMPAGQGGAFADHRGKGGRSEGEGSNGTEQAAETRTGAKISQSVKNAASSLFGGGGSSRTFSTHAVLRVSEPAPPKKGLAPTQGDRNSPAASDKGSLDQHPGYTTGDAPIDSSHPSEMPEPHEGAIPSSSVDNASTKAAPPHPGVHVMADGANQPGAGADAQKPEDRTQKVWGANARSAQFNAGEGKRRPLAEDGSNEGGFKGKPGSKSRT